MNPERLSKRPIRVMVVSLALALTSAVTAGQEAAALRIAPESGRQAYTLELSLHRADSTSTLRVGYDERAATEGDNVKFNRVITLLAMDHEGSTKPAVGFAFGAADKVGAIASYVTTTFGEPVKRPTTAGFNAVPARLPHAPLVPGTTWTIVGDSDATGLKATYRKDVKIGGAKAALATVSGPNVPPGGFALVSREDGRILALVAAYKLEKTQNGPVELRIDWRRNNVAGLTEAVTALRTAGLDALAYGPAGRNGRDPRSSRDRARSIWRTVREANTLVERIAI